MSERRVTAQDEKVEQAADYTISRTSLRPEVGLVLGSGLGDFARRITECEAIPLSSIPNYPQTTVHGHAGNLLFGKVGGVPLLAFQGRIHFYETGSMPMVLFPILVAARLGLKSLILTNAAGGINKAYRAGDLMLITDQLNLTFERPLGTAEHTGADRGLPRNRRPVYDPGLITIIARVAKSERIRLRRGVYCGVKGPAYETKAEISMLGKLGCDAVGMSTVHEASFAAAIGMKVAGISCITNLATGLTSARLSHAEVTDVADKVQAVFCRLMESIIREIGSKPSA